MQQESVLNNYDAILRSCDFFIVTTHNYDFSIAIARNYAVIFRNYGSQCDRSYGVTAPQFHRSRTHGMYVMTTDEEFWRFFCVLFISHFLNNIHAQTQLCAFN